MNELYTALGITGIGAALGQGIVSLTGLSAVGAVGSGVGYGAAAGPVGIIVGAVGGLATYGALKAFDN